MRRTNIATLIERRKLRRKVQGIAAALLPYEPTEKSRSSIPDNILIATHRAGLMNAVNMDTGYVNLLKPVKSDVLRWTPKPREKVRSLPEPTSKIKPATSLLSTGNRWMPSSGRRHPDSVSNCAPARKSSQEKAAIYQDRVQGYPHVLAFELGTMFAPNGEIFDEETVRRLMDIPEIKGMKHSSLDRLVELKRLALRDTHRPDFRIYTETIWAST